MLLGDVAHLLECAAQDAGDLHLADAQPRPDLGLCHVVLEAQPQHVARPRRDPRQQAAERDA